MLPGPLLSTSPPESGWRCLFPQGAIHYATGILVADASLFFNLGDYVHPVGLADGAGRRAGARL